MIMMLEPDTKVAISKFSDELVSELPEVPTPLIKRKLLSAVVEFCRDSLYWLEKVAEIDTSLSQASYDLVLPSETLFANKVLCFDSEGKEIDSFLFNISASGTKIEFASDVTGLVSVALALQPETYSCQIPSRLVTNYRESIVAGAAEKLCKMPSRPWSNPGMVAYYQSEFSQGISDAKRCSLEHFMPHQGRSRRRPEKHYF